MPLLNKSSTINTLQPIRYTLLTIHFSSSYFYILEFILDRVWAIEGPPFSLNLSWDEMNFRPPRKLWTTTHRHTHDENREISTGVRLNQQVKLQRWAERRVDHRVGIVNNIPPCGRSKGKRDFPSETRRGIKRWREGGAEVSVNRLGKIRKED